MKVKSKVPESVIPVNLPLTEQESALMPNLVSLVCGVGSQGPRFPRNKNNRPPPSFCSCFEFFIKTSLLWISQ